MTDTYSHEIHDDAEHDDNIRQRVYNADDLAVGLPHRWAAFTDAAKCAWLERNATPIHESTMHNITCVGLDEWVVDALTGQVVEPLSSASLVVGTGTTEPTHDDTALTSPAYRTGFASVNDAGRTAYSQAMLDTTEANDVGTITEIGIECDGRLLNHALVEAAAKSSGEIVTYEGELSFTAAAAQTQQA